MAVDGLARMLEILANGESVPASRVAASTLVVLRPLFDCGAVRWKRSGAGQRLVVEDLAAIERFILTRFPSGTGGTTNLSLSPRATAVANFGDAHRGVSDKSVVLVRGFGDTYMECNGRQFHLAEFTRDAGAMAITLSANRRWHMVGCLGLVENLEVFLESTAEDFGERIDAYVYYGGRLPKRVLAWLASSEMKPCTFLHLPDYDPVGIDSYLSAINACPGRVRLYVPPNLKQLALRYGKAALLTDSPAVWRRVRSTQDPSARRVVDVLNEVTRGLEQEVLQIVRARGLEPESS